MQAAEVEWPLTPCVFPEAEKQSRVAVLLERLHAKHSASRPWQETSKVVRQAMVRPPVALLYYTLQLCNALWCLLCPWKAACVLQPILFE